MNSSWYDLAQLVLGAPVHNSGHVVHPRASYISHGFPKRVIYKLNKKGQAIYSLYEVALSAVSEVFLEPFLTPQVRLVKTENNMITGVASDHMYYYACQRHQQKAFSFINNKFELTEAAPLQDNSDQELPINFLDQFPKGFFAGLYARHQDPDNPLYIDMRSLASVLTSAQTLEEDDLHKGNLGFYIVDESDGPVQIKRQRIVFFKIDHDLMMANHLMSFFDTRPQNFFYNERAFAETRSKLEHFPGPDESAHHGVAKPPLISKPFDSKVYSAKDIKAFRSLAQDRDFIQNKWKQKLSHILVDEPMLRARLERVLSTEITQEKSCMDVTVHAVMERLAHSRAVLFSVPEFREYILGLKIDASDEDEEQGIEDVHDFEGKISKRISSLQQLARQCKKGDTPLHCAIRMGQFRFDESLKFFAQDLNQVNAEGDTPLDLAIRLAGRNWYKPKQDDNPGADGFHIANYLIGAGAKGRVTPTERKLLSKHSLHSSYPEKVTKGLSIQTALVDLGLDNRFTLKMKKDIALQCLQQFINTNLPDVNKKEILEALREGLNGLRPNPAFDYIRQFRSSLWIIRWFRSGFGKHCGLFGETATCNAMNRMINAALNKSSVKPGFFDVKSTTDPDNGLKPEAEGPTI